jgi:transcriptional regulator with XRE-family HTH domain
MEQSFQEKVGARIAQLRQEKQLSQQKLAVDANLERTHLTHIEKGRKNISLSTLEKVIKGLEISVSKFFEGEGFK